MPMDTFLRKKQVLSATGLKHSALYELIAQGKFPKPIKLSPKCSAWSEYEITEWQNGRKAARTVHKEIRRR